MVMEHHFGFFTTSREFHLYSKTINWKIYKGQKVTFKGEHKKCLHQICSCWKNSAKRQDQAGYCSSCSKRIISLYLVCHPRGGKTWSWSTRFKTCIVSITVMWTRTPNKVVGCIGFTQKPVEFSWLNEAGRILDYRELFLN